MVTDDLFYHKFRDWIIGVQERADENDAENEDGGGDGEVDIAEPGMNVEEKEQKSDRVAFFLHQMDMIPNDVREVYNSLLRAYPSSLIFASRIGCYWN